MSAGCFIVSSIGYVNMESCYFQKATDVSFQEGWEEYQTSSAVRLLLAKADRR